MQKGNAVAVASHKADSVRYVVSVGGRLHRGTAEQILRKIQAEAKRDSTVHRIDLDQYAEILVNDAPNVLPDDVLHYLRDREYPTQYDRALVYLANMEPSGVRILSTDD